MANTLVELTIGVTALLSAAELTREFTVKRVYLIRIEDTEDETTVLVASKNESYEDVSRSQERQTLKVALAVYAKVTATDLDSCDGAMVFTQEVIDYLKANAIVGDARLTTARSEVAYDPEAIVGDTYLSIWELEYMLID